MRVLALGGDVARLGHIATPAAELAVLSAGGAASIALRKLF
jgi:hypothetical protein